MCGDVQFEFEDDSVEYEDDTFDPGPEEPEGPSTTEPLPLEEVPF